MSLTKKRLEEYCQKKKINVPRNASVEFLQAAIVRASMHNCLGPTTKNCFGLWENDNATCVTCDLEAVCFETSIGMSKEDYFKKMDALESHKIRTVKKMRGEDEVSSDF